jgi:hypothetical protein
VVAPAGTVVARLATVQLDTAAVVPLNVTVPVVPKWLPLMATAVPGAPDDRERL